MFTIKKFWRNTVVRVGIALGLTIAISLPLTADGGSTSSDPIDEYGWNTLMNACQNGDIDIVRQELARGVDVERKNSAGATAISIAAESGNTHIVAFLLDRGASINTADNQGWTALLTAVAQGHEDTARLLIEKGANVNVQNDRGSTPLTFAAEKGFSDVARALVLQGADVNHRLPNGMTPLTLAMKKENYEIVELLKKAGGKSETQSSARRVLEWKRLENPMGFTMPFPNGWVDRRDNDTNSIILAPLDGYILSVDGKPIASPAVTLMVGARPSNMPSKILGEGWLKYSAKAFKNYQLIEKHWIKLYSGQDAVYQEFTFMKGSYPYKVFAIHTFSSSYMFIFDLSGRIEDMAQFDPNQIMVFLREFNPGQN